MPTQEITFNCNHGIDGWHEIGCPHQTWTNEELQSGLNTLKKSCQIKDNLLTQSHSDFIREAQEQIESLGKEYEWTEKSVGGHVLKRVLELPIINPKEDN